MRKERMGQKQRKREHDVAPTSTTLRRGESRKARRNRGERERKGRRGSG
jgi:hypothetical protein